MQIAAATAQQTNLSNAAATPVELAADEFIGKDLLRVDWNDAGMQAPQLAGIVGAREGYETLSSAIEHATSSAAEHLQLDADGLVKAGSSYAVVEAADRYAVMTLNELLAMSSNGRNYRPASYETHRSGLGDAIRAVIDGYGNVVRHSGRFGL